MALWLHAYGHPYDLETAIGVLSRRGYDHPEVLSRLEQRVSVGWAFLNALTEKGWIWKVDRPGVGHLERTTGKRGRPQNWVTYYVWMACHVIEEAVKEGLDDPAPPYARYRVSAALKTRRLIREFLETAIPTELLPDEEVKKAINSWLTRRKKQKPLPTPPPWEEPLATEQG